MAKIRLADLKVGMTVKTKTDTFSNWGVSKGDPVDIIMLNGSNITIRAAGQPQGQSLGAQISQLDFFTMKKAQIEDQIAGHKKEIEQAEAKLQWMKVTNNEEYDEDEFKVWHTLQIIKDPKTNDEVKAKAIAALIKGK